MKLHHFTEKVVTAEAARVRNLGKALSATPPVVQSTSQPVIEAKKKVEKPAPQKQEIKADDLTQAMRDFAEDQLEKSSPHVHRKIRHFD
jgi:hypothetical protein